MRPLIFLYLIIIGLNSCTSRSHSNQHHLQSISFIDRNGMTETISNKDRLYQYEKVDFSKPQPYQKILRIYQRDLQGNIHARITSYHPNGQPKQYLEIINSRAFGNYQEWYENGSCKLIVKVIGGDADINPTAEATWLFDGCAKVWDEEGNLTASIMYEKGALEGESLYYHKNGNIWKKIPYKNNQMDGLVEFFLENESPLQRIPYSQGKRNGIAQRFWEYPTIVAAEENFREEYLEEGRYYYPDGSSVSEIVKGNGWKAVFGKCDVIELHEYKDSLPEGQVKIFGPDKELFRLYHVRNGLKHGEEVEFYEMPGKKGVPKLSISWHEGKIQGLVKTWYDNGIQESQKEMSQNSKNGVSIAWYQDGTLMLLEEYDNNKLIRGEYYRLGEKTPLSTVVDGKGLVTLFDSEGHFLQKISYEKGLPSEG